MKRRRRFLIVFPALALLLGIAAGALFAWKTAEKAEKFPAWIRVSGGDDLAPAEGAELEFLGLQSGETQDVLRLRCRFPPSGNTGRTTANFLVLYYSEAEKGWYLVYCPSLPVMEYDYADLSGEADVLEKAVPHGLFSREGRYQVGFPDLGFCQMTVDGERAPFFQPRPFPTESGFPCWTRALYADPQNSQKDGIQLEFLEVCPGGVQDGEEKDLVRVRAVLDETASCQGELSPDGTVRCLDGFEAAYYSPEEARWFVVYAPCFPASFASGAPSVEEISLAPGEYTLEFSVPHGLFSKSGKYGIRSLSLGWTGFSV